MELPEVKMVSVDMSSMKMYSDIFDKRPTLNRERNEYNYKVGKGEIKPDITKKFVWADDCKERKGYILEEMVGIFDRASSFDYLMHDTFDHLDKFFDLGTHENEVIANIIMYAKDFGGRFNNEEQILHFFNKIAGRISDYSKIVDLDFFERRFNGFDGEKGATELYNSVIYMQGYDLGYSDRVNRLIHQEFMILRDKVELTYREFIKTNSDFQYSVNMITMLTYGISMYNVFYHYLKMLSEEQDSYLTTGLHLLFYYFSTHLIFNDDLKYAIFNSITFNIYFHQIKPPLIEIVFMLNDKEYKLSSLNVFSVENIFREETAKDCLLDNL